MGMKEKDLYKTFSSSDSQQNNEEDTKTLGIGLSTANALTIHLGGKFRLKNIKDSNNNSVATEAIFTIPTCSEGNCHLYSESLK